MREKRLLNQSAFNVEGHTQLKNDLNNSETNKTIRKHPLIHVTPIISVMNITVRNQILNLDVDWRIMLLQIFQNRKFWIINFTGTWKSLKLMHID